MEKIWIKCGRVIDAKTKRDNNLYILIENGKIARIVKKIQLIQGSIIHAERFIVTPAFIDMHAHLREPGLEYTERIRSRTTSGGAGRFTTVACMPNPYPSIGNSAL